MAKAKDDEVTANRGVQPKSPHADQHPARLARGLMVFAAAAALVAFTLDQLGSPSKDGLFNADSNYLILLVGDLIQGGSLSDWVIAPHFYLFPDGLFTLAILAALGLGIAPYGSSAALYGAALIGVGTLLWRLCTGNHLAHSAAWSGIVISSAFALIYLFGGAGSVLGDLVIPANHSGIMLCLVLCFVGVCYLTRVAAWRRREWVVLASVGGCIALVTLSDILVVVWGVLPLAVVLLSQARRMPRLRLWQIGGVILAATLGGYLLSFLLGVAISQDYAMRSSGQWRDSTIEAMRYFGTAATFSASPLRSAIFYANVGLWIVGFRAFFNELGRSHTSPKNLALIFVAAASALCVLAAIVPGAFSLGTIRYFIPYLFWGIISLVAAIPIALTRWRYSTAVLGAALASTLAAGGWLYANERPLRADVLASCLEARHLESGAASFWDALPLMVETEKRIHVVSLAPTERDKMAPFPWLIKRNWVTRQALTGGPATPKFVILSDTGPTEATVVRTLGAPSDRFACADRAVLRFDRAKSLPQ